MCMKSQIRSCSDVKFYYQREAEQQPTCHSVNSSTEANAREQPSLYGLQVDVLLHGGV
jgi:hypothetical protein